MSLSEGCDVWVYECAGSWGWMGEWVCEWDGWMAVAGGDQEWEGRQWVVMVKNWERINGWSMIRKRLYLHARSLEQYSLLAWSQAAYKAQYTPAFRRSQRSTRLSAPSPWFSAAGAVGLNWGAARWPVSERVRRRAGVGCCHCASKRSCNCWSVMWRWWW